MSAAARAAAALARMGHEDLLDVPDTHSDAVSETKLAGTARNLAPGLGARRLWCFRAMHGAELEELAAALAAEKDPEARAWSGRVLRLLGRAAEARAALDAAAAAGVARAALWRAELDLLADPAGAENGLRAAVRAGASGPAASAWLAQARLLQGDPEGALAALEGEAAPLHVARLLRVQACFDLGRDEDARAAAETARRADPASPSASALLGRLRGRAGDLQGALEFYHEARDLDLEVGGDFVFEMLGAHMTWKDPESTVLSLDRALAEHPEEPVLLAERAEILRHPRLCRYDEALKDYAEAVRLAPRRAWIAALLARALNYRDGGRAGLEEFDRAAALNPKSGWIRAWRGALLARVAEHSRAAADLDAATELMPWYPFSYAWRGGLRNRLGKAAEARRDLDAAIALDPTYAFSWGERFQSRLALGDTEGALADLGRAFRMDPKYAWISLRGRKGAAGVLAELDAAVAARPDLPWLRAWRGHALLELGRPADALADLEAAAAALPREAAVTTWSGSALARVGRGAEARGRLEEAARLDPSSWAVQRALADLYGSLGEGEKRLVCLRRASELAPTTVSGLVELAESAFRMGREDEALAVLARAVELDRRYPAARVLAAQVHLSRGRLDEAERELAAAFAAGGSGRAHLVRGMLRHARGDFQGQIEDFRAALKTDPGAFSPEETEAVRTLVSGGGRRKTQGGSDAVRKNEGARAPRRTGARAPRSRQR